MRSVATIIKMWNNIEKWFIGWGRWKMGKVVDITCRRNEFLSFSRNLSILRDLSRCSSSSGVNRSLRKCVKTSEQQFFLRLDILIAAYHCSRLISQLEFITRRLTMQSHHLLSLFWLLKCLESLIFRNCDRIQVLIELLNSSTEGTRISERKPELGWEIKYFCFQWT